jgi:hypothetical protein
MPVVQDVASDCNVRVQPFRRVSREGRQRNVCVAGTVMCSELNCVRSGAERVNAAAVTCPDT